METSLSDVFKNLKIGKGIDDFFQGIIKSKNPVGNDKLVQYFACNFNTASSNKEIEDGMVDVDFDGNEDINVKYKKDKNGDIVGAEVTSLKGEKFADVEFEYSLGKISKIEVDNNSDSKNDYVLLIENKKNENGDIKIKSATEIAYKNEKITTKKETKYDENSDLESIETTNYKNGKKINSEKSTFKENMLSGRVFQEFKQGVCTNLTVNSFSYENGALASIAEKNYENGKLNYKTLETYDDSHNITSAKSTEFDGTAEVKNSTINYKNGVITDNTTEFYQDGKISKNNKKIYENGVISKETTDVYSNNKVIGGTETFYEYENENLTKTTTKNYQNNKVMGESKTFYEYEDGILTYSTTKQYEQNNLVGSTESFYGEKGNLTATYPIDQNSKNGIVEFTKQGGIGDCWLLASINTLKFQNPEILNNMISYTKDGAVVKFAFGNYEVTDEELKNKKAEKQHNATGDDDIIRIEIAMEKMLNDYVDGNIKVYGDKDYPLVDYKHGDEEEGEYLIHGGFEAQALYFMTGKPVSTLTNPTTNSSLTIPKPMETLVNWTKDIMIDEYIDNLQEDLNSNTVVATVSVYSDRTCNDVNGNEITLYGPHAYSIKEITKDTVTIVNPWDGKKDIVLNRETFKANYNTITTCKIK